MKNILFTVCALLFLASSCKNDAPPVEKSQAPGFTPGPNATADILTGIWYASGFVARAGDYGSVIRAQNATHVPYTYALFFDPNKKDSVLCYDGTKSWALATSYNKDTVELKNAVPGKSAFLVYNSQTDKTLSLFDNTSGKVKHDRFQRTSGEVADGYTAFENALNHHIFNGMFKPLKGDKPMRLLPNGKMENFPDYDAYRVCTSANCFVTGSDMDVITLTNTPKKTSDMYGFMFNVQKDSLSFYNLERMSDDAKSGYKAKGIKYKFAKMK